MPPFDPNYDTTTGGSTSPGVNALTAGPGLTITNDIIKLTNPIPTDSTTLTFNALLTPATTALTLDHDDFLAASIGQTSTNTLPGASISTQADGAPGFIKLTNPDTYTISIYTAYRWYGMTSNPFNNIGIRLFQADTPTTQGATIYTTTLNKRTGIGGNDDSYSYLQQIKNVSLPSDINPVLNNTTQIPIFPTINSTGPLYINNPFHTEFEGTVSIDDTESVTTTGINVYDVTMHFVHFADTANSITSTRHIEVGIHSTYQNRVSFAMSAFNSSVTLSSTSPNIDLAPTIIAIRCYLTVQKKINDTPVTRSMTIKYNNVGVTFTQYGNRARTDNSPLNHQRATFGSIITAANPTYFGLRWYNDTPGSLATAANDNNLSLQLQVTRPGLITP